MGKQGIILLAEREAIDIAYIRSLLERNGWAVEIAKTSQSIFKKLSEIEFSAILLNASLIGSDQKKITKQIHSKEEELGREIPIIGISNYSYQVENKEFKMMGVNACLSKPIYQSQLFEAISFLGNPASFS
ncbi:MAG: CheY-like chemotaxis protein [Flammeovirgaceae bacterium]|jgi:CheY-like chemotaxis protein